MPNTSVYLPNKLYRKIVRDAQKWEVSEGRTIRSIVETYYRAREEGEISQEKSESTG